MNPKDGTSAETLVAEVAQVRQLLDDGKAKSALWKAKHIHKRIGTTESEALLVDAYLLRAKVLLNSGLLTEAGALLQLVRQQHATTAANCADRIAQLSSASGDLTQLVAPLIDQSCSAEQRDASEQIIRQEVTDLTALACCAALPADHALRVAAAAVVKAFEAVTSGPVDDQCLALPQVSRRSPLAPWKMLIRAIALFYRQDNGGCRRCLDAIDAQSAAARLIPAIHHLLGSATEPIGSRPAAAVLSSLIQADEPTLRQALADLERVFDDGDRRRIDKGVRQALKRCRQHRPDLLEKLRQLIFIHCIWVQFPIERMHRALGGQPRRDANFWRLMARLAERAGGTERACSYWECFTRHAIDEGWLGAESRQAAVLYAHMAGLLEKYSDQDLTRMKDEAALYVEQSASLYEGEPAEIRALAPDLQGPIDDEFLSPAKLFRRAVGIWPHETLFVQWLTWAQQHDAPGSTLPDEAASAWHEAVPGAVKPLLYLMASSEKRNANKKALAYLDKAEALDGVNRQVRQAKLRLWFAITRRHLKSGKQHLALKDLAQIEAMPSVAEGDRPALVAALRTVIHRSDDGHAVAEAARQQVAEHLQSEPAAALLITYLADACGVGQHVSGWIGSLAKILKRQDGDLTVSFARLCALGAEVDLQFVLPKSWLKRLIKELDADKSSADAAQLLHIAKATLDGQTQLAYAAAGAGLRLAGATAYRGHLLLARGECIRFTSYDRAQDCFLAAAELARRQRDDDLTSQVSKLIDRMDYYCSNMTDADQAQPMSEEQLNGILVSEQRATRYPREGRHWRSTSFLGSTSPKGRQKPSMPLDPSLFDAFEDNDFDPDADLPGQPQVAGDAPTDGDNQSLELGFLEMLSDDALAAMFEEAMGYAVSPAKARSLLEQSITNEPLDARASFDADTSDRLGEPGAEQPLHVSRQERRASRGRKKRR
jgi:hypothetical protein